MDVRIPVTALALLVLAAVILAGFSAQERPAGGNAAGPFPAMEMAASCEGGTLWYAGPVPVAELDGDFHRMGRQYGCLLGPQIRKYYHATVANGYPSGPGTTEEEIRALARSNYPRYPSRVRSILEGMAETSGLTADELVLTDQYAFFAALLEPGRSTHVAAWGNMTGGGPLVFGSSAEPLPSCRGPGCGPVVIVYNPADGSSPVASVCHAGEVSTMNAVTKGGLVLALNPAPVAGETVLSARRVPQFIRFIVYWLGAGSTSTFEAQVLAYRTPAPFILDAAGRDTAYSYECGLTRCVRRDGSPDGFLVATGHYQGPLPEDMDDGSGSPRWNASVEQAASLAAHIRAHRGGFDTAAMRQALDAAGPGNVTGLRYVVVPEEGVLWVRAPGDEGWGEADLRLLFW